MSLAPTIVVTGVPRSGTSLCMQLLEAAGVPIYQDGKKPPDPRNPRGYYESSEAQRDDPAWLDAAAGMAVKVMGGAFLLPPDRVRLLLLHRDPTEVAASWAAAVGQPLHGASALGHEHLWQAMRDRFAQRGFHVLEVHHRALLADPVPELRAIQDFLGLSHDTTDAMVAVIDQGLYRHRS